MFATFGANVQALLCSHKAPNYRRSNQVMARKTWPDGHPYTGGHYIYRGTRNALYLRDRLRCVLCKADCYTIENSRGGFTLDHVRCVLVEGRNHDPSNLITCCRECNVRKGTKRVTTVFGKAAADRVRRALARKMPAKVDGLRLNDDRKRHGSRVPWAAARGWLDSKTLELIAPCLDLTIELSDEPSDDIPF